jgi:small-conductance mechanosensitive channel
MTHYNWLAMAIILLVYIFAKRAFTKVIRGIGSEREVAHKRVQYVLAVVNFSWGLLALTGISIAAGVNFKDFGVFLSSALAILGVSLFATWSILSNVTASVIVFFFFPYRVGDKVKIIDGENSIEGMIKEITLFHVILEDSADTIVTYPNTLIFQKPVSVSKGKSELSASAETDFNGV